MDEKWYTTIDNVVDGIFLIDIILMFFTSFFDNRGIENFESLEIAKHYLKSIRFIFDFGAILGTGVIT